MPTPSRHLRVSRRISAGMLIWKAMSSMPPMMSQISDGRPRSACAD
jgi:hypothetical protein